MKYLQKISFVTIAATGAAALPFVAFGQTNPGLTNIASFLGTIQALMNTLVPIIILLAVLYFLWGLAQFVLNAGDDAARTEGRNKMIWGIVGLFVMVSVWGIVNFLQDAFGTDDNNEIQQGDLPTISL